MQTRKASDSAGALYQAIAHVGTRRKAERIECAVGGCCKHGVFVWHGLSTRVVLRERDSSVQQRESPTRRDDNTPTEDSRPTEQLSEMTALRSRLTHYIRLQLRLAHTRYS